MVPLLLLVTAALGLAVVEDVADAVEFQEFQGLVANAPRCRAAPLRSTSKSEGMWL